MGTNEHYNNIITYTKILSMQVKRSMQRYKCKFDDYIFKKHFGDTFEHKNEINHNKSVLN